MHCYKNSEQFWWSIYQAVLLLMLCCCSTFAQNTTSVKSLSRAVQNGNLPQFGFGFEFGARGILSQQRYVVYNTRSVTFKQAMSHCRERGRRVLVVSDQKENDFLRETLEDLNADDLREGFWLGISDEKFEGIWLSVYSGEPITFSAWGNLENAAMGQKFDCAFVAYRRGIYIGLKAVWDDISCRSKRKVICELPNFKTVTTPSVTPTTKQNKPLGTAFTTTKDIVTDSSVSTVTFQSTNPPMATTGLFESPETRPTFDLNAVEEQIREMNSFRSSFVERITTDIVQLSRNRSMIRNVPNIERIVSILATISTTDEVSQISLTNVLQVVDEIHDSNVESPNMLPPQRSTALVRAISSFADNVQLPADEIRFATSSNNIAVEVLRITAGDSVAKFDSSTVMNSTNITEAVTVRLPVSIDSSNKSASDRRVSFISYEDDVFFPSDFQVEKVVSVIVSDKDVLGDLERTPLQYVTPLRSANSTNQYRFISCSFWNVNESVWSSEGCSLVEGSDPPECQCTHLSNFALIVRLHYIPSDLGLDLIGKIGCSLSILGFFFTSYIYIHFPKLRNSKPGPIHIHLCSCLGTAYLVFLIGSDRIYEGTVCIIVAAGTHYFLLAAWLWMFIEGIAMYRNFVVRFGGIGDHFILKSAIACYTIPTITVSITLGVTVGFFDSTNSGFYPDPDNGAIVESTYIHESFCWLHGYTLISSFLGEIGIIFIVNCFIYGAVVRSITWGRRRVHSTKAKEGSREHVIKATSVSALLGLTWIFSLPLFLSTDATVVSVFSYLFSILNSLQGVAIFFLFCVRNRSTRNLWWQPCWQFFKSMRPQQTSAYQVTQV